MSYSASHLATVPASGFKWYLIFLEGSFTDEIRKEIDANFNTLGREVGKDVLVVRGLDPTEFRESVYEASAFLEKKWRERARPPALIVINCAPAEALGNPANLEKCKLMIFSLADVYQEHKSISGFLTYLVDALKQEDALKALETLDGDKLQKVWGWLSKYLTMEPSFYGFSINLDKVLKDLLAK